MKKYLILTVLAVLCLTAAQAQQYTEVVYLKNGSMIRGTVVEQVPGESFKIRTADGSIFVYRMDEVQKITKEQSRGVSNSTWNGKKYRGHLDLGYLINARPGGSILNRVELTTSHGAMVLPKLFVGAGIGLTYFHDIDAFTLPIFANVRATFPLNKAYIFADGRVGYAMGLTDSNDNGLYWAQSVGVGIRKIELSLGYLSQYVPIGDGYNFNLGALAIRFGVRF